MSVTLWGGNKNIEVKFWTFPGGERNVKIIDAVDIIRFKSFTMTCGFKGSDDIIDMMLLMDAIKEVCYEAKVRLCIPYFPAARQDRVMTNGESFGLRVYANIIASIGFTEIEVYDPHSDVLAGMFPAGILQISNQHQIFENILNNYVENNIFKNILVSPDAGAMKKIYKVARLTNLPVICAQKTRDVTTGEIVSTEINIPVEYYGYNYIIVDDICDGGRTFVELANKIKEIDPKARVTLAVTHGIFSKGLDPLFESIDEIICFNNMSEENLSLYNMAQRTLVDD